MKKQIALSLFLLQATLFGAPQPNCPSNEKPPEVTAKPFTVFTAHAGVGYSSIKLITSRGGIKPPGNTNYGGDGVAVQLKVGDNYTFCDKWLVGLEAYGQYNSAQTENRFFERVTSTTPTNRTFDLNWNLGVDVRLGVAPSSSNLLFLYGGPDWGYYDFQYKTDGIDDRFTKFKLGWALGAGLEQVLWDHWTLRATFDYRWYASHTVSHANGETQNIKARLGTALFLIGYRF